MLLGAHWGRIIYQRRCPGFPRNYVEDDGNTGYDEVVLVAVR
jgi:hypothetical protein